MTAHPLISVITPFLNVGAYLPEAIGSVLSQTFPSWELLLVDDGSKDDGADLARDYAARHPDRIRCYHHTGHANRGISASRNLGFRHARGRWIASLDGDDQWLPTKLEQQVAIVKRYPDVRLVLGATCYWYSWTGLAEDRDRDEIIRVGAPQDSVVEHPHLCDLLYPIGQGAAPSMNTALVRADLVEHVGGWEESFTGAYEDQAFLVKLYLESSAFISSHCWDLYRQRPGSCMQTELKHVGYHYHRRHFLEWFATYMDDRDRLPRPIWAKLQRSLRPYRHPLLDRLDRLGRRVLGRVGRVRRAL